ncbi:MAG: dodecin domain-containing protein [Deltaproteobacteria bacterium]|nr:dodecin domain-containing protein [Deltaproteobacteria bacterium]
MNDEKVYKFVEFVGTSKISWEDAAMNAVNTASKKYSDLRIGEIIKQDLTIEGGKIFLYRVRINISYRFHL